MDQQKIGMLFRSLREEEHLTQERLSEIIGVSNRTVSRWENGRNIPDLSIMMQLSVKSIFVCKFIFQLYQVCLCCFYLQ